MLGTNSPTTVTSTAARSSLFALTAAACVGLSGCASADATDATSTDAVMTPPNASPTALPEASPSLTNGAVGPSPSAAASSSTAAGPTAGTSLPAIDSPSQAPAGPTLPVPPSGPSPSASGSETTRGAGGTAAVPPQGAGGEFAAAGATGSAGETPSVEPSVPNGAGQDPMPWFTFFQPSMTGLLSLAPDPVNGFGGDLGGLAGADQICTTLAQQGNPGDTKQWRAFLSAAEGGPEGGPVHAIERIGNGPWHDFNNRLLASDLEGLLPDDDGRPRDTDPQLAEMFTDEYGDPVSPDTESIDNHDTLTGSDDAGRLPMGATLADTCNDWTSTDESLNPPIVGHAWPRSANNGRHWINEHEAGGCGAGISTVVERGNGTPTVGANGGYGAIYCFAVSE